MEVPLPHHPDGEAAWVTERSLVVRNGSQSANSNKNGKAKGRRVENGGEG